MSNKWLVAAAAAAAETTYGQESRKGDAYQQN